MKQKNTILNPVVADLSSRAHPLGKEINLRWHQSSEASFWVLRRPWVWPSGKELPLLEVGKSSFMEALFPSPYALLDGFHSGSPLQKIEIYQLLEREFPRKGLLFILEYYQKEIMLRSYSLGNTATPLEIMNSPKIGVILKEVRLSANSRLMQLLQADKPDQEILKIKDFFTEKQERIFQLSLVSGEVLQFKKMQILKLSQREEDVEGELCDIGLEEETDYYYSFLPRDASLFRKVQTHRRAFSPYSMESRIYSLLPSHYITQDRKNQLERFLEVVGYGLNEIRGLAEELRDIQDLDHCRIEMLPLLAQWLGWEFPTHDASHLRQDLKEALTLYRRKGTKRGLRELIQKLTGKKCRRIVEYRHQMFFTNEPLNLTNDSGRGYQFKTCYHPPSTISIEFAPFEEWQGSLGLEKKHIKKLIEKFLPAHVKIGEVAYTILPLREAYRGVMEEVVTVLESPAEKVFGDRPSVQEKTSTTLQYKDKKLKLFKSNDTKAKTNDAFYRTYHPLIEKGKGK